jgi:pantoate--beta-alanine ligase
MIILKKITFLKDIIAKKKAQGHQIGFVPTMGALHEGHISLIKEAAKQCSFVVASIYVNPTQFNNQEDFKKYPITIEEDILALTNAGCNALFLPDTAEIYPSGTENLEQYDLGELENILEGRYRPGHFQGVCRVVNRLVEAVNPDYLFLGQKDAQQCKVIAKMLHLNNQILELIIVPTSRAASGLALSSRNKRLSEEALIKATALYQALLFIQKNMQIGDNNHLIDQAKEQLLAAGFESVDYISIANQSNLADASNWNGTQPVYILGAAFIDGVRLIDNTLFVG